MARCRRSTAPLATPVKNRAIPPRARPRPVLLRSRSHLFHWNSLLRRVSDTQCSPWSSTVLLVIARPTHGRLFFDTVGNTPAAVRSVGGRSGRSHGAKRERAMGVPNLYGAPGSRIKPVSIAVGVVLGGMLLLTTAGLAKAGPGAWTALTATAFQSHGPLTSVAASVGRALSLSTLNPWYWGFVFLLTVIQWFWPARRDQRSPSVDMAVDAVWFVAGNVMQVTVVAITLGAATVAYNQLAGNWSLNLQPMLGFWGLSIIAFVVADFLAWISHWCHHKV